MPRKRTTRPTLPPGNSAEPGNANGSQQPQTALEGRHGAAIGRPKDFEGAAAGDLERIAERRAKAFHWRKQGLSYREIGRRLEVDVHTAYNDVQAELLALRGLTITEAETVRTLELERLDELQTRAIVQFAGGNTKAGFLALSIMERRARLLGLDKPVKVAPTDPSGDKSYESLPLKALPEHLIEQILAVVELKTEDLNE